MKLNWLKIFSVIAISSAIIFVIIVLDKAKDWNDFFWVIIGLTILFCYLVDSIKEYNNPKYPIDTSPYPISIWRLRRKILFFAITIIPFGIIPTVLLIIYLNR